MSKNVILVEGSSDVAVYSFIMKNIFKMSSSIDVKAICFNDIDCKIIPGGGLYGGLSSKLQDLFNKYEANEDIKKIGIISDLDNKTKNERERELKKVFNNVFQKYINDVEFFTFICEDFKEIEFLLKESKTLKDEVAECFYDNFRNNCKGLGINDYQIEKLAIKYWMDFYLKSYCCKEIGIKKNINEKCADMSKVFKKDDIEKCFDIKYNKFLDNFEKFLNNFKESSHDF